MSLKEKHVKKLKKHFEKKINESNDEMERYRDKLEKLRKVCDHDYKWDIQEMDITNKTMTATSEKIAYLSKECKICGKCEQKWITKNAIDMFDDYLPEHIVEKADEFESPKGKISTKKTKRIL